MEQKSKFDLWCEEINRKPPKKDNRKVHFLDERSVWGLLCERKPSNVGIPQKVTDRPSNVTCSFCLMKLKGKK